jgi:hypothetical protein
MTRTGTTAERYRDFATRVARAESPLYERLTAGVAGDPVILAFLDELPYPKRHPQLLLAAVRSLGGAPETCAELRAWVVEHRARLAERMLQRSPQVNDAGRCAPVLPLLASLPQPLALLEVGASAGLCLFPDRYRYELGDHRVGVPSSPVRLRCAVHGRPPLPAALPRVAWRAGIDLEPLDVWDEDDVRWLEALLWPGQVERTAQLRAAVAVARGEPPWLVRGDLNDRLLDMAGRAPAGATLVVIHSAALSYLDPAGRDRFAEQVRRLDGHWICQELPHVLPEVTRRVPRPPRVGHAVYTVAMDGTPVAFASMHGDWLDWFGS